MQNQANKISSWPILIQKSSGNPLDRCPGDYWEKKQFISTYQCNTLIRCRRMTKNNLSWPLCQKFSKICYKLNKHSYKVPYDQLAIVFHLIFIHLVASLEKLHWIISFFQETILQPKLFFCLRTAQYPNKKSSPVPICEHHHNIQRGQEVNEVKKGVTVSHFFLFIAYYFLPSFLLISCN